MAASRPATTLVVYADFVCPFCYLGKASLERYRESASDPPTVEWQPFDLRGHKRGPDGEIDHDIDDGKDDDYFTQVRENVDRLADRYEVAMAIEHAREVDSWDAQVVTLGVEEHGGADAADAFRDAVFEALWVDGRDIGEPAVLVDVGGSVDVPEAVIRDALADGSLDAALRDRFESARAAGITAVPTFVYGDHAARGAVPPAQLRRLIEGA